MEAPARETGRGLSAFGRVVAIDPATFAREHWDHTLLLTRAADLGGGFGDLLSADAVDELVGRRALRQPFFRMVSGGSTVGGTTRSAVAGSRTIADLADADAMTAAHGDGATLVLQSLHRMWPPVGELCRDLAAELGHETQCNAYVTPGGEAQGFAFHHDTHDVFVLQVEGRKRWQIHAPVVTLPTKSQPRAGNDLVPDGQEPLLDVVLEPGDTLYLPRGYVHAAQTTDTPSIHLTIGVVATTWLDVLTDALARLGPPELALRHALPVGVAEPVDAATAGAELLKTAQDWLSTLTPEQLTGVVERRLNKARVPEPLGMMRQAAAAASLTEDTDVRPRGRLDATVTVEGGRAVVVARAKRLELPAVAARLLGVALAGPSTPAAMVANDPDCDVADALVVTRRLLREGVLVAV